MKIRIDGIASGRFSLPVALRLRTIVLTDSANKVTAIPVIKNLISIQPYNISAHHRPKLQSKSQINMRVHDREPCQWWWMDLKDILISQLLVFKYPWIIGRDAAGCLVFLGMVPGHDKVSANQNLIKTHLRLWKRSTSLMFHLWKGIPWIIGCDAAGCPVFLGMVPGHNPL